MVDYHEFEVSETYPTPTALFRDLERRYLKLHGEDAEVTPVFEKGKLVEVIGTHRQQDGEWTVMNHEHIEIEELRPVRRRAYELRFSAFWC